MSSSSAGPMPPAPPRRGCIARPRFLCHRPTRRLLALVGLAGILFQACRSPSPVPAVVIATVTDDGDPVPGALAEMRAIGGGAVSGVADAAGRIRLELPGPGGPGTLEVARDMDGPRIQRAYSPLLIEPGDSAVLVLDLARQRGRQARFGNDGRMARWGRAVQAMDAIEMDHARAYDEWVAAGQPGELVVPWGGVVDSMRAALSREEDPAVRSALWAALLTAAIRGAPLSARQADRALQEMDPGAAVWSWRPWSVPTLIEFAAEKAEGATGPADHDGRELAGRGELAGRRAAAYLDRLISYHPDPEVKQAVLLGAMRLAEAGGRRDDATDYYEQLLADYPGSQAARLAEREAPGSRLQVGDRIPDVELPTLDPTAPPIRPGDLAGPATLIDFWAAWCTPCVAEMPVIEAAYERFQDRGFDVVSVSFDASRDDVRRFRQQYPMPWHHAFVGVEALSDGAVAAAYGINGLPFAVLVGPGGRIVALEDELRGAHLAETLERVLGTPAVSTGSHEDGVTRARP